MCVRVCVSCSHTQESLYLTLCDSMDCSLPGASICGVSQARILECIAIPFSRESSRPRDQTQVSCIAGGRFNLWATREAWEYHIWWATFRGFICFLEGDWCIYEYNWGHGELSKPRCPIVVGSRHQGYLIQRHRYSGGWCAGGDELWLLTSIWIHDFPIFTVGKWNQHPCIYLK